MTDFKDFSPWNVTQQKQQLLLNYLFCITIGNNTITAWSVTILDPRSRVIHCRILHIVKSMIVTELELGVCLTPFRCSPYHFGMKTLRKINKKSYPAGVKTYVFIHTSNLFSGLISWDCPLYSSIELTLLLHRWFRRLILAQRGGGG